MKRQALWYVCAFLMVAMVLTLVACGHQHTYTDDWSYDATNHWHKATCTDGDDCAAATGSVAAHEDADSNKLCDVCGYDMGHTHTYADTYSFDETNHWKAVTCGCKVDVKDKTAHTGTETDKVCDDCGYDYGHTHTYAETYTSNEAKHWKAATCGCTVAGIDEAKHFDSNNDGACEDCGYNGGHEHTYDETVFVYDATNHWYAADCGHSVKQDEEAHTLNSIGLCTACGYIEGGITVDKAIALGGMNASLVNGGTVVYMQDAGYGYIQTNTVGYTFGENSVIFSHANTNIYYSTYQNQYILLLDDGSLFALDEYLDETGMNVTSVENNNYANMGLLKGYCFNNIYGSNTNVDTQTFYGTEALLAGLYEMAKASDMFEEYVAVVDSETFYVFTFESDVFTSWDGSSNTYSVTVTFTLSADYSVDMVSVYSECYAVEIDEFGMAIGTSLLPIELYNYTVIQTTGERTAESKYSPDNVLMTEFELFIKEPVLDAEGQPTYDENWNPVYNNRPIENNTLAMTAGKQITLGLNALSPDTALPNLDQISYSAPEGFSVDYFGVGNIWITAPKTPGTYEVTIKTLKAEVMLTVVVTAPPITSIEATVNGSATSNYNLTLDVTAAGSVIFGAIDNNGNTGNFTAALAADTVGAELSFDEYMGEYTLNVTAEGTYVITLTCTDNPEITATLTINAAKAAPVESGSIDGTYTYAEEYDRVYTAVFTFANGVLTIADDDLWYGSYNGTYNYVVNADGTLTLTTADGTDVSTLGNSSFAVTYIDGIVSFTPYGYSAMELIKEAQVEGIDGTYTYAEEYDRVYTAVFTFANGVLTIADDDLWYGSYNGTYNYVVNADGTLTLTTADGADVSTLGNNSFVITYIDGVVSFTPYGYSANVLEKGASAGGGETVPQLQGKYIYEEYGLTATFIFDNGTLSIDDGDIWWGEYNGTYSYEVGADGYVSVSGLDGSVTMLSFTYIDGVVTFAPFGVNPPPVLTASNK